MKGGISIKTITVNASGKYDVLIGKGLLERVGELTLGVKKPCMAAIISDDTVFSLYGNIVTNSLRNAGYRVVSYVFPHGESFKNADNYIGILEFLAQSGVTRGDMIVALGGGVTGDLAGFSAATYLRGIPFLQIPTTFLAAIDSSVGGKTGIDLKAGKNLAGAFWQPLLVVCDYAVFDSLPPETFADGVSEAVKYGVLRDETLLKTASNGLLNARIEAIISSCVGIKRDFVEKDEFDTGARKLLNLGHTFGHAVEKLSSFEISHGKAVSIGLCVAARISEKTGLACEPCHDAIAAALEKYGLPTACPYPPAQLARAALTDKKREQDKISLILIKKIESCIIKDVPVGELPELAAIGTGESL